MNRLEGEPHIVGCLDWELRDRTGGTDLLIAMHKVARNGLACYIELAGVVALLTPSRSIPGFASCQIFFHIPFRGPQSYDFLYPRVCGNHRLIDFGFSNDQDPSIPMDRVGAVRVGKNYGRDLCGIDNMMGHLVEYGNGIYLAVRGDGTLFTAGEYEPAAVAMAKELGGFQGAGP